MTHPPPAFTKAGWVAFTAFATGARLFSITFTMIERSILGWFVAFPKVGAYEVVETIPVVSLSIISELKFVGR